MTWRRRNRSASAWGSSRRVDDRARPCGCRRDALPDVLGTLRDAEHRAPRGLQHLARARVDLARDEERDEHVGELGEVALALDEVVLVAAVRVARAVGVVLEEEHLAAYALFAEALLRALDEALEDAFSGLVVDDEVADRVALGCRVLGMAADVEVEAGAVLEEHVARPTPRDDPAEEVTSDLVGAQPALAAQGAGDAVFVLEAEDAPVHCARVYGYWMVAPRRGPRLEARGRSAAGSGRGSRGHGPYDATDVGIRVVSGSGDGGAPR